jgi:hypothetical protein
MNDTFRVLGLITEALVRVDVIYRIGGSVASSALGMPRSTLDIDVVADLKPTHIAPLANLLGKAFYFDQEQALEAIQRRSSFNLLHFETSIKIDLFLPKTTPFEQSAFSRETQVFLGDLEPPRSVVFSTAEDTILHKLRWYDMGGRGSERQWNDILGVMQIQTSLDTAYLQHWAAELGLGELLEQAFKQAEL